MKNKGFIKESRIRVGDVYVNNVGDEFKVIEYLSSSSKTGGIKILFKETGSVRLCSSSDLLRGEVKDLMKPSVCGVGFIGQGRYSSSENGIKPAYYLHWHNMLKRCYERKNGHAVSYEGCVVDTVWMNLQEFSAWCTKQPLYNKVILGRGTALDKDLLVPDNKLYSSDTCLIIPEEINIALSGKHRYGKKDSLPCGVYRHGNKFAVYRVEDKNFDRFYTVEEAVINYKQKKDARVKELLYKYKEYLDETIVIALQNFSANDRDIHN